jgi:hypothetical protein
MGPTHPLSEWILGVLSLDIKQLGFEADHSLPFNAEVIHHITVHDYTEQQLFLNLLEM